MHTLMLILTAGAIVLGLSAVDHHKNEKNTLLTSSHMASLVAG